VAAVPIEGGAAKGRVLVVDDDPGTRDLVQDVLRHEGFLTEAAEDGLQALVRLQHAAFDVIVSDLLMPHLDGLALLREVGRMAHPPPVVIQTSFLDRSLERQLRQGGAFRVLLKGSSLADLVRSVEEAWTASRVPPARCA
jgi:CheY-like chemotaxis protein